MEGISMKNNVPLKLIALIAVTSMFISHGTEQQKGTQKHDAAFVFPIVKLTLNDQPEWFVLLCRQNSAAGWSSSGCYDAPGGERDKHENEPLKTALREFREELLLDKDEIFTQNSSTIAEICQQFPAANQYPKKLFYTYVVKFNEEEIINLIKNFNLKFPMEKNNEKDKIALVALRDLLETAAQFDPNNEPKNGALLVKGYEFDTTTGSNTYAQKLILSEQTYLKLRTIVPKLLHTAMASIEHNEFSIDEFIDLTDILAQQSDMISFSR